MKPQHTTTSFAPRIANWVAILLSMAAVPANATTIADIAGDYTGPTTLPADWSYFYSSLTSGATEYALTPNLTLGVATGGTNVGFGTLGGTLNLPGVLGTKIAAAQFEIFPDGDANAPVLGTDLVMHPGSDAEHSTLILRYTISAAKIASYGTSASIAGSFRDLVNPTGGNSVTVSVYHNTTQLFTKSGTVGTLTQANGTFNISDLTVAADDTISFVLNSNNEWGGDETALRGTIALVVPVRPSANIDWTGAASSAWNALATNWKLASNDAPTEFLPNDTVFFHDNPTTPVVDISDGNVNPLSATFDHTTATAYTLQGTNGIATGTLTKSGNGSLTITNSNSTSGAVALNGGLTSITTSGGLGSGALSFDGGVLEYTETGATANWAARNLTVNAGGGSVDVTDSGTTLSTTGTLSGAGLLTKLGAGTLVLGQSTGTVSTPIAISGGTLDLNHGAGTVTYSGNFTGSDGSLQIDGSGTLTLTGANDYTGTTTVTQGTLAVNNTSASGTGSGAVTVQSTATLAGTGSISGSVSIESGGFVAPGNAGIGTLTVASATLSGTYKCQLDATTADQVVITGALSVDSGAVIAITTLAVPTAASYTIATYGSLVGSLPAVTGIPSGYVLDTATAGQLKLAPVPANVAIIAAVTGPSSMPAGWSYLYSNQASGGTEVALTPDLPIGNGGNSGFGRPERSGFFYLPGVIGTQSGPQYEIFTDGDLNAGALGSDLLIHPDNLAAASNVILRYTISAAAIAAHGNSASIAGSFRELIPGGDSVTVSVYHNATQLFAKTGSGGTLTQANGTFDISGVTVAADDTISFVVNANTTVSADETALRGAITLTVPVRPAADIYWTGAASEAWNTLATNWELVSTNVATEFQPNDAVFFHDNPTTSVVDISDGNVSPLSTTFDNTTATAYTLQGSNGIATGTFNKSADGSLTITNSNSTYGAVALNGGLTSITYGDGLGSGAITFDGGALEYTGATANWGARDLTVNAGGGSVDVTGSGTTLSTTGTLTGAGQLTKQGAGTLVLGQTTGTVSTPIAISGGTLTLNHGAGAVSYSGKFTGSGGDLRLVGSGTLTLSGPNDYTGTTTVTQGTLAVNNTSDSGTGSGAVTVKSAATLAGTGSISGSVSIESGGFVAPGNAGIGTLTVASAALTGTYKCQLDVADCDQVVVIGELTVSSGAVISVSTLGTPAAASYLIATYGSLVGSLPVVTGIPRGYVLDTATAGQLKLSPMPANVTIIADVAADYTGPSALPVGWSYLYSSQASGGTEVALTPDLALGNGGNSGFGRGAPGIFNLPGVIGTQTGAQYEMFTDGDLNAPELGTDLLLHPGPDAANNTIILRYTISAAEISSYGTSASIAGSFRDLIPGGDSVTVSIYHNATQLFAKSGSAVTGTLTEANGLFNISGLAVAADDTISFVVNAKTNIGADETALRGTIALVKSTGGFSTWADSWTAPALADKTPGGDPDGDGISNLLEYVIGGDPRVSSTGFLPEQAIVGSDLVLSYQRSDDSEADTTQTGQWSTNLTDWYDLAPVQVNENDSAPDDMEIRIPLSNAADGQLFGRLHVTMP
ncbi:MAG: autotransporter-associated beta strand repeat-containing protein [Verrucomicrobia bacterium]|nr:autotransporter-associated beta strand repeat-containing protein [Verrucomicrobiota bacterium]